MWKYIVVALIAYLSYDLFTNHTHDDVMILLKVNDDVSVKAVKMLRHTDTLFKVKSLINSTEWNYAVLGKSFFSVEEKAAYVSAIQHFSFVEKLEERDNYGDLETKPILINVMFKITKFFGNLVGYLPKRPLKPEIPPLVKCDVVEVADDEPIFSFSFMRVGDQKALEEYGRAVMTKMLPAIDARFVYMATSKSERFPLFNILWYDGKKTFCEYMESEFVIKYGELYMKAFDEIQAFSAVKV